MTVPLTAFLPLVKAYAPSVPNPVAEQMLRLSARDFCVETRLWRQIVTVAVTANPFSLAPDAYTSVVGVESAIFEENPLDVASLSAFRLDELDDVGLPQALISVDEEGFRLQPFEAGTLKASIYLAPQSGPRFGVAGATTQQALQGAVPDFLFNDHGLCIAWGALKYICLTPNQAYSDPAAAGMWAGMFKDRTDGLKTQTIRGKQRAPVRTRASYF